MAAAAAMVKLLRSGGRSSASSSHLLPSIGRRMEQGGLAPLLPRLGSSPAVGVRRLMNTFWNHHCRLHLLDSRFRPASLTLLLVPQIGRLLSVQIILVFSLQGSFPSKLDMLKNNHYMLIKGSYQPYNSIYVILDLQKKILKMGQEMKLDRRRGRFSSVLVVVVAVMALTVWSVDQDKEANKNTLAELKQSLAKTESDVEKLKIAINESKKVRIVSNAYENH